MEDLNNKYDELLKIYRVFTVGIKRYQEASIDEAIDLETREFRRDSLIKRFELMYDFLLKYLREYIFTVHGISIYFPRKVFQKCLLLGITNESETNQLVDLIQDRNLANHAYDIDVANQIATDIQKHHEVIGTVIKKVSLDTIKK